MIKQPISEDDRSGIRGSLTTILDKSKEALNEFSGEKLGWVEAGLMSLTGAAIFGIGGLIVGAVGGWFVLPAVAGWAGATIATSAAAGTALATGSFLGLNAAGWGGAIGGLVMGALASLTPLSHRAEKKTEYKVQSILTPDIEDKVEEDAGGRPIIDLRALPRIKVNEITTTKSYRLGDLMEDTVGTSTGLVGLFTGAAVGVIVAGIVKLAEARHSVYDFRRKPSADEAPPSPKV